MISQKIFKLSIILMIAVLFVSACNNAQADVVSSGNTSQPETQPIEASTDVAVSTNIPTVTNTPVPPTDTPEPPTSTPEPPTPTPEPEMVWLEFMPANGSFSVLLPDNPEETTQIVDTDAGPVEVTFYTVQGASAEGNIRFYGVTDPGLTFPEMSDTEIELRLDASRDGMLTRMQGVLVSEEEIFQGDHPARELEILFDESKFLARIVFANNRFYQFIVGPKHGSEFTADDYEFLDSFTPLAVETAAVEVENVAAEAETTPPSQTEFGLGDAVDLGKGMSITVNSLGPYEGSAFLKPKPGNQFLMVDITVNNGGADTGYFIPFTQTRLMDAAGQTFELNVGTSALVEPDQLFESEITPGQQNSGLIGYEAAENAEGLILVIDTTPYADGGEVSVVLN